MHSTRGASKAKALTPEVLAKPKLGHSYTPRCDFKHASRPNRIKNAHYTSTHTSHPTLSTPAAPPCRPPGLSEHGSRADGVRAASADGAYPARPPARVVVGAVLVQQPYCTAAAHAA
eukprot:2128-Chlamydomonas_euryale.AAC.1